MHWCFCAFKRDHSPLHFHTLIASWNLEIAVYCWPGWFKATSKIYSNMFEYSSQLLKCISFTRCGCFCEKYKSDVREWPFLFPVARNSGGIMLVYDLNSEKPKSNNSSSFGLNLMKTKECPWELESSSNREAGLMTWQLYFCIFCFQSFVCSGYRKTWTKHCELTKVHQLVHF